MPRKKKNVETLPIIPLRGLLIFPHVVTHFDVGRPHSIAALECAMGQNQRIFLIEQKDEELQEPGLDDFYPVGTVAIIRQVMHLPGDVIRVLAEGVERGTISKLLQSDPYMEADVLRYPETDDTEEMQPLSRALESILHEYAEESNRLQEETAQAVLEGDNLSMRCDMIAANVLVKPEDRRLMLDTIDTQKRAEALCTILNRETELSSAEKRIQARVRSQVDKNQKDYYLREQIKSIQVELGDTDEAAIDDLRERLKNTPLNDEAREKCLKQIDRMSHMPPGTPEIGVSRSYIEWILDMPWGKSTEDNLDLNQARRILESNHYGLEKVKERIVEYLAVLKLKKNMKGPILCFVGPPGVGKTSIVRAIAEAVGRKFVQMSLGGVRDEAEIRGHRRTYIGAIPGRIITGIKQAGSMNPVFLFDEIDKMASDYRGDPASAMLEVLDAQQNFAFRDHYLDVPFDLSQVMFITTANSMETIPGPLLDRMEIIEVPSYTEEEKLQIARLHLWPKQIAAHGLEENAVSIDDTVLRQLIENYTREAGVRTLERTISKVIRKSAVTIIDDQIDTVEVTADVLEKDLGAPRYLREQPQKQPLVGIVNGLAYTTVGGELLQIECAVMPGKGALKLTGKLGDVMKESAEAAFSWVRSHSQQLGLADDFYEKKDIHIHVPEGAVPKDGPSAGVTMTTALVSAFTNIPVRQDVAMTGEITLRGRVLPIGGLKEKSLAAYRAGITTLIIPKENQKDLEDIPAKVLSSFRVIAAEQIETVLDAVLVKE